MNWLDGLKVGHCVIVKSPKGYTVDRIVSTNRNPNFPQYDKARTKDNTSFSLADGSVLYGGTETILPATEENREMVRICSDLSSNKWTGLSLGQLRRIKAILDEGGESE